MTQAPARMTFFKPLTSLSTSSYPPSAVLLFMAIVPTTSATVTATKETTNEPNTMVVAES